MTRSRSSRIVAPSSSMRQVVGFERATGDERQLRVLPQRARDSHGRALPRVFIVDVDRRFVRRRMRAEQQCTGPAAARTEWRVEIQPASQVFLVIGRGREDQADLLAAPQQSIGEQLPHQKCRTHLVGATVVHAHDTVERREFRTHHELEGVAHRRIAPRGRRDSEARDLAHFAQCLGHVLPAQRPRVLEARADLIQRIAEPASVTLEDDVRDLRFVNMHAQHAAPDESVVDHEFGLHVAVAHVQLAQRGNDGVGAIARDRPRELVAIDREQLRRGVHAGTVDGHGS